jgi:hypothetical protein
LLVFVKTSSSQDSLFIYGTVKAKDTGEKFHKATVYITTAKIEVYTDKEGFYKLYIPKELLRKRLVLNFKYVGYDLQKRRVRIARRSKQFNIHLSPMMQSIEAL